MKVVAVIWTDCGSPRIEVVSRESGRKFTVEFEAVSGLRMLTELDLAAMWHAMSNEVLASSWLFEVTAGGWFELECQRADFYTQHEEVKPREFLVAGYQECVSVFSQSVPKVYEAASA